MSQNIPLSERLPKCRIFLGNLASEKTSKGELRNIFAKYGNIIEDPVLRRSFGFIQYDNPDSALKAIEGEQGRIIGGMKLDLSIADNREPRSGRNNNSNNNNNNNNGNNNQRKDKKGSNNGNTSPSRGNSRHDKRAERRNERAPYEKRDFNRDNYRNNNNNNGNRRRLRSPEQDEIPKILCQVVYLDKQQRDYARKISKKIQENSIPCEDYFIENQSVEHTIKRAIRRDINYVLFVGSHNEKLNTTNLELLHSDGKESYPDIPFSQAIELLIKEEEVKGRRPSNSFNKNVHGDPGPIINNNFADHHNYSQTNGHPNFDLSSFLANSYISQMPFNNQPANVLSLLSSILANSNSTTSFPNTASSSPISSLMNGFNSYSNPSQHQSGLSVPNGNSSSTSSSNPNNNSSNNNTSSNNSNSSNSNNTNPTSNNASNGTSNSSNNHTPNVNNLQIDPMTLQQLLSQQSLNNLMLSSNLNQLANQLSVLQSTSFAYNNTTNNGLNGHTPPASAQNNTSNLNYTPQSNGSSSNGSSNSSTFNHHNSANNEYRPMVHSNANSGSNTSSTQDLVAQQMSLQKNLREMLNSQRSNPPFENGNSGGKTSDSSSSSNSMYNNNNLALLFNQNPSSQSPMNYNP